MFCMQLMAILKTVFKMFMFVWVDTHVFDMLKLQSSGSQTFLKNFHDGPLVIF